MKTESEQMRALMEAITPEAVPTKKLSPRIMLNQFLKSLDGFYHEHHGSSTSNTSIARWRGNQDLNSVVEFLKSNGYEKIIASRDGQEWTKEVGKPYGDSSKLRSYHSVKIAHKGDHVYNVSHLVSAK